MHSRSLFPNADRAVWKPSLPRSLFGGSSARASRDSTRGRRGAEDEGARGAAPRSRSLVTAQRRGCPSPPARARSLTPERRPPSPSPPPKPPTAPTFRDICYLHELRNEDLLSSLSLPPSRRLRDPPAGVQRAAARAAAPQRPAFRQRRGRTSRGACGLGSGTARSGTVLVIPRGAEPSLEEVAALHSDAEFTELYGDKVTSGFRRGAMVAAARADPPAPSVPPPTCSAAPVCSAQPTASAAPSQPTPPSRPGQWPWQIVGTHISRILFRQPQRQRPKGD
eukprot:TRINITY_DN5357_c0_g1_i2.p1 TRINITY_DN5357_c0_g1~~TRINITY_DN5357_c0_g1_i2.p1  ORF type:complete len:280 (+),score=26.46 TRINITY_DN5357_c0_g1_i2:111-950(+)